MTTGLRVEERIPANGRSAARALAEVAEVCGAFSGYSAAGTAIDRLRFTRSVRPRWATITAILLAPTGIALLLLLFKRSEVFEAIAEEDHRGAAIRLSGIVAIDLHETIVGQLAESVPGARVPTPESTLVRTSAEASTLPSEIDLTRVGGSPLAGELATRQVRVSLVVQLDTGQQFEIAEPFAVLGRDPIERPGDPPARRLSIEDPSASVSKTHLAFGRDAEGVWVSDRHSTNGTVVIDLTGEREVQAGQVVRVLPGATVRIGDRTLTLDRRLQ